MRIEFIGEGPFLLDLYCCAGGASVGYERAGWTVIGVDIAPQPHYPYQFIQADAISAGYKLLDTGMFKAVHASPPCQAHSDLQKRSGFKYPDLIPETRAMLKGSGIPYVIENVDNAPLNDTIMLCGTMFPGLRVYRHRLFESNAKLKQPAHPKHVARVFTHDKRKAHYGQPMSEDMFVQVTGGGNATVAEKLKAMGIDWMNGKEVNEAIPPAYSEFIGKQLMEAIMMPQDIDGDEVGAPDLKRLQENK